mgnify:CR=1 FL=1
MELTREQAINEFRRMWAWIALETYGCRMKMHKEDYMETFSYENITCRCFLCEYVKQQQKAVYGLECKYCPISFRNGYDKEVHCSEYGTAFTNWGESLTWQDAAKYAWEIANLEEKYEAKREE